MMNKIILIFLFLSATQVMAQSTDITKDMQDAFKTVTNKAFLEDVPKDSTILASPGLRRIDTSSTVINLEEDSFYTPFNELPDVQPAITNLNTNRVFLATALSEGPDRALAIINRDFSGVSAATCPAGGNFRELNYLDFDRRSSLSPLSFNDICAQPVGTNDRGEQCGYQTGFSQAQLTEICRARNAVIDDTATNPESLRYCHPSNCTTASYLGIVNLLKTQPNYDEIKDQLKCRMNASDEFAGWGPIYGKYILGGGLRQVADHLRENFGIQTETHSSSIAHNTSLASATSELDSLASRGIPTTGDPIQIDRSRSGHAAIFGQYRRDSAGTITHVCYWTSNQGADGTAAMTSGYNAVRDGEIGNRCEPIRDPEGRSRRHIRNITMSSGFSASESIVPIDELADSRRNP
tara:strand:- start:21915 stop:23138 length:1224 start_codon:yes stop_codon:yes gene_type:complete